MSKLEQRFVCRFTIFVIVLTTIPYLLAFCIESYNPDQVFSGFLIGVEDGNSYIAKALRGSEGEWLFKTPYTLEHQTGVIAFLPYLIMGKLVDSPERHLQLVILFHLMRIVACALTISATYMFISFFIGDFNHRKISLIVTTIGGGLGWLFLFIGVEAPFGSIPLEYYSPESFGFLSLFNLPHLSFARAFLLWGLIEYVDILNSCKDISWKSIRNLSIFWLLVAISQPITALIFGYLIFVTTMSSILLEFITKKNILDLPSTSHNWKNKILALLVSGFLPGSFLVYTYYLFVSDSFLNSWTDQNKILSPHPAHYIIGYGLLLPLAIIGIYSLKKRPNIGLLPVTWFLSIPILAYAPVNVQRRLVEGAWISVVILAIWGYEWIVQRYGINFWGKQVKYIWLFTLPSAVIIIIGSMGVFNSPTDPIYYTREATRAYQYVGEIATLDEVVLCSYQTGNVLPAWSPVRVVVGHGPESVNLEKWDNILTVIFNRDTNPDLRYQILQENRIEYIFWGPDEKILGKWNPSIDPGLLRVYASENYEIFKVK